MIESRTDLIEEKIRIAEKLHGSSGKRSLAGMGRFLRNSTMP